MKDERLFNYLAGFLEADGCVCVAKKDTKYPTLMFQIGQCRSRYPLELFLSTFGGAIYEDKHKSAITKAPKIWKYIISNNKALEVLKELLPFCKFRRDEWNEAIKYYLENRINNTYRGRSRKY